MLQLDVSCESFKNIGLCVHNTLINIKTLFKIMYKQILMIMSYLKTELLTKLMKFKQFDLSLIHGFHINET